MAPPKLGVLNRNGTVRGWWGERPETTKETTTPKTTVKTITKIISIKEGINLRQWTGKLSFSSAWVQYLNKISWNIWGLVKNVESNIFPDQSPPPDGSLLHHQSTDIPFYRFNGRWWWRFFSVIVHCLAHTQCLLLFVCFSHPRALRPARKMPPWSRYKFIRTIHLHTTNRAFCPVAGQGT